MTDRWSDERMDLDLRELAASGKRPVAPAELHALPRTVVSSAGGHGTGASPAFRRVAPLAVAVSLLIVAALVAAGAWPRSATPLPTTTVASEPATATPWASTGAYATGVLPDPITDATGMWRKTNLPAGSGSWEFFDVYSPFWALQCGNGAAARTWRSGDGMDWMKAGVLPAVRPEDATCATGIAEDDFNTRLVAVGSESTAAAEKGVPAIWTSEVDGSRWSQVPQTDLGDATLWSVAAGNGWIVLLTLDNQNDATLWRSSDLAHWTRTLTIHPKSSRPAEAFATLSWAGAFVATTVGSAGDSAVYHSVDGLSWQKVALPGTVRTLVANPGRYGAGAYGPNFVSVVAKADKTMVALRSDDGLRWTQSSVLPITGGTCNFGVLACASGGQFGETGATYYYSAMGDAWQPIDWPQVPGGTALKPFMNAPDRMFITMRLKSPADGSEETAIYVQWTAGYLPHGRRRRGGGRGGRGRRGGRGGRGRRC